MDLTRAAICAESPGSNITETEAVDLGSGWPQAHNMVDAFCDPVDQELIDDYVEDLMAALGHQQNNADGYDCSRSARLQQELSMTSNYDSRQKLSLGHQHQQKQHPQAHNVRDIYGDVMDRTSFNDNFDDLEAAPLHQQNNAVNVSDCSSAWLQRQLSITSNYDSVQTLTPEHHRRLEPHFHDVMDAFDNTMDQELLDNYFDDLEDEPSHQQNSAVNSCMYDCSSGARFQRQLSMTSNYDSRLSLLSQPNHQQQPHFRHLLTRMEALSKYVSQVNETQRPIIYNEPAMTEEEEQHLSGGPSSTLTYRGQPVLHIAPMPAFGIRQSIIEQTQQQPQRRRVLPPKTTFSVVIGKVVSVTRQQPLQRTVTLQHTVKAIVDVIFTDRHNCIAIYRQHSDSNTHLFSSPMTLTFDLLNANFNSYNSYTRVFQSVTKLLTLQFRHFDYRLV